MSDTSNLADNLGLINVLLLASLKMNRDDAHATLWVEFLKALCSYFNVATFLNDSFGFPYSLLGTILKLQCFVPFESSDEYSDYSGKGCRSNLTTGLILKFKPTPCPKDITPMPLQLTPRPSECVFRQLINNYLDTLYDVYTGRIPVKDQSPTFCMSISTLLHLICHAAQSMDNPRQLFDHLYNQVQKCQATEGTVPTRHLDVFAFDVQISSMCLCPTDYQPTEPLHTYFVGAHELRTLMCDIKHTPVRDVHSCPTIGWIMTDKLTSADRVILQHAANGVSLHAWAANNAHRLQFIDSIHVPFPDKQVEIPFPLSPTASSTQNTAFLALSLADGLLLYEPVVTTLTESEDNNLAVNRCNLDVTLPEQTTVMSTSDSSQQGSSGMSVLHVCEYEDCFKVKLHLRTPFVLSPKLKVTLAVSCNDQNPLCATLKLNIPTGQKARHLQTVLQMPVSIEKMQSCEVEVVDDHTVQVMLKKDHHWLQARQEKLDVELLHQWPVNRPLGVLMSMFTEMEIQVSKALGGLPYGHDSYLDARSTLRAIYTGMIDQQVVKQGAIKLLQVVDKLVLVVSSLTTGFIAFKPGLLITAVGTPVIELHYLVAPDPPTPETCSILRMIHRNHDFTPYDIRCSEKEITFLFRLLEKNSKFLSDETSKHMMNDVHLKKSFLVPLYPKENHHIGEKVPKQSESLLMKELDRRRRQTWGENYRERFQDKKYIFVTVGNVDQSPYELLVKEQLAKLAGPGQMQKTLNSDDHCSYCSQRAAKLKRCGHCHNTLYCNADCQKKDWTHHKKNCISSSK